MDKYRESAYDRYGRDPDCWGAFCHSYNRATRKAMAYNKRIKKLAEAVKRASKRKIKK